ncbi:hypothetical protein KEJ19_07255 [Candidatus Bathyarchaeota archaeon]|nr:hypothetical protein [Candidatus Bathyarchaeota archaeon]
MDRPFSFSQPHPWKRKGPGLARDGKPKFNLFEFDETYFQRLYHRVQMAAENSIYVSIMLFEGHMAQFAAQGWEFHPFNSENNISKIHCERLDYYTLKNKEILEIQEAYVRKVIDTINDFDNVLYEICNEAGNYSTEWQYHFIRFIKSYERDKPKQHPVGMTFQYGGEQSGNNANLFNSPADWTSPNPEGGYREDPPLNDGRKVILNDTDHLWGKGGNPQWVWKSFTRGHNPLFMDRIVDLTDRTITWAGKARAEDIPKAEEIRKAMGLTIQLAKRFNLAEMLPLPDLASTRYCLAKPREAYIIYTYDSNGEVRVDLHNVTGEFHVEWIHPVDGSIVVSNNVQGGGLRIFKSPLKEDAVLLLYSSKRR